VDGTTRAPADPAACAHGVRSRVRPARDPGVGPGSAPGV